ncbi:MULTISPECIES: NmrA family NAD(P)-binding protein [unclassified Rhizobium]|uniref:NmrA family NAD(P)-binding protein n=1 Tax=unclassified Rhizobium TaxID=2613769 RepID=UPI001A993426|nr:MULTISPECIES: NmrA family NAD(P)-binding protein [unclassified Rhizobium]MBX5156321.1 NmrA family NAD(P)-binding protein [Rhizobium sp. NZLR8]MBX5187304.1 NmrA family NAD(P)-binding protein [Rhizobium sp. NZLR3b]MBX5198582.1 NmrA family NAD(P)-binding protein [Rhizobium sp. NZLR10]MBX5200430.1 NmrA family NAD(P)-binding protein [Rhizobium sp. NZLR1]MBX5206868.1 NmrA family NAD(P)-binding protein [Rhizobium sp. NZLR11]
MSVTILAVGAAGDLAGLVIPALVDRGALVRGLVRKPEQVQTAKDRGAHEVAAGISLTQKALMRLCKA